MPPSLYPQGTELGPVSRHQLDQLDQVQWTRSIHVRTSAIRSAPGVGTPNCSDASALADASISTETTKYLKPTTARLDYVLKTSFHPATLNSKETNMRHNFVFAPAPIPVLPPPDR